jgi:hypothetical protein
VGNVAETRYTTTKDYPQPLQGTKTDVIRLKQLVRAIGEKPMLGPETGCARDSILLRRGLQRDDNVLLTRVSTDSRLIANAGFAC